MKKFLLSVILLLFFSSHSSAEIAKDLVISGNKRISNETIKVYGDIILNKDLSARDLDKILKNLYSTEFFEDVNVELSNNKLKINVTEYPVINQIIIIGEDSKKFNKQIKDIAKLKEKRSFIKSQLVKDVDRIKNLYSLAGYNKTTVTSKVKKNDDNSYDLLIEINRGDKTKISSINFIGNKNIKSRRLRSIIASEESKFWKVISNNTNLNDQLINLDLRLLTNYYKSIGYYDVKVNSNSANLNDEGMVDLIYTIEEGNRYIINKISANVDSVFDKKIFVPLNESYKKHIGSYYSPFKVKNLLEELDELINNNDLQFVEHNVKEVIDGDSINIIFNVFEGEKVLVERINITGNTVTNESVIRSELILDEGDPFTKLNLDKSISEIKARRIFKKVDYTIVDGSKNNLKVININVEEQPTGEISAGAGIGTSGGTVAFNIQENNWLGNGKVVGLEFTLDKESLSGTLNYNDPNYDFMGNSLNYSISSEKNDKPDQGYENSIITTRVGTSFEQYKNVMANLGLGLSFDDLQTDESASASLKKQSGDFLEFAGNYGFTLDRRDRAFMPTNGSIISFNQSIPIYADKSFISNNFSASKYKELNEDVVGAAKIYLSAINGLGDDDVRLSKRKGLSTRRLRGFEKNKVGPIDGNDHIGGNYAAAINFESNLPNLLPDNLNTDISLFLDFGNVWGVDYDSSIENSNKVRSSTGIAANWLSPIGPLSLIISQSLSKADTDKTESFTFNLGTTF
jgi:outer membrane protein insertion porin family